MNRKIYLARVAAVAAGICITGLASPTIREGSVSMTQAGDRQVSIRYTHRRGRERQGRDRLA